MDGPNRAAGFAGRSLSLVIPAYNEAAGIGQAVAEADAALADLAADYEILVVDDGSRDGTAAAVTDLLPSFPHVRLLRHPQNLGYGAALRTGFEAARGDRVAFTDADCQFHLADLGRLLCLTEHHPVAVGYRVGRQDAWLRCFLSRGYNRLARALLGIRVRDCDCALKVFRRDDLADLLPQTSGFFVNTEMLTRARQLGFSVAEAGVRHRPRRHGASKVSLRDVPRTLQALLPFWWSRVLFPNAAEPAVGVPTCGSHVGEGDRHASRMSVRQKRQKITTNDSNRIAEVTGAPVFAGRILEFGSFTLLMLVAGLLFFGRLGCPLLEPDEARYAEVARQMLAADRWVVPVLHDLPYHDKPPLLFWLVMGCYRWFGVHDWAARLVPGMVALLTVLVTAWWGRKTVGVRAGFLGGVVLCLSARYVHLGRMLTMNTLLALCVVATLAAAHLAVRGPRLRWPWWLASAAACGLGLLTKGPVALALVLVPVLAFRFLDCRTARVRWPGWLVFFATAAAVAAPWYVAVLVADPGFGTAFFWRHNVVRFVAPFNHAKPIWYHLPGLLLGMLPWTLLLPALLRHLARRSGPAAARRPAALGFFLLAFLWGLAFFSAAGSKRAGYVLPVMPPLALALGCYLDAVLPRRRPGALAVLGSCAWRAPSLNRLAFRACLLVQALGCGTSLLAVSTGLVRPGPGVALAGAAGLGLAVIGHFGRRRLQFAGALCGGTTFVALLLAVHQLLPAYTRKFSLRDQVRPVAAAGRDRQVPVACYPRRWDSVHFYLQRDDVRAYAAADRSRLIADLQKKDQTLLFVKSGSALRDLLNHLPASLEFVPQGRQGSVTAGWVVPRKEGEW